MSKGEETRGRIVDRALRLASRDGFRGLTIGTLAEELGLSKSGLFAHFGSKDELQLQVLEAAVDRFKRDVIRPGLEAARGEPRLRAFFDNWLRWGNDRQMPGGCVIVAAAVEFDDQPGPQREMVEKAQRDWHAALAKAARIAVDEGHFRADVDTRQLAFDVQSIVLGFHHAKRLLREPNAERWAKEAFDRVLAWASAAPTLAGANAGHGSTPGRATRSSSAERMRGRGEISRD